MVEGSATECVCVCEPGGNLFYRSELRCDSTDQPGELGGKVGLRLNGLTARGSRDGWCFEA